MRIISNFVPACYRTKKRNFGRTKHTRYTVYRYKQCQQQNGSSDSGLFALAFAAVLASGRHPSAFHFDQPLLRKHLHSCIQQGHLSSFSAQLRRENRKATRHLFNIFKYCYCRMPETFSDTMINVYIGFILVRVSWLKMLHKKRNGFARSVHDCYSV